MKRDTYSGKSGFSDSIFNISSISWKTSFPKYKNRFSLSKIMSKAIWSPQVMDKKIEGTHKGRIEEDWGCQQFYNEIENFLELH